MGFYLVARSDLLSSAACAAGGGDADGEAEPDEDDDAESDDVRMRLAKLEAMEHGELDWDGRPRDDLGAPRRPLAALAASG